MNSIAKGLHAMALVGIIAFCPQKSWAERFTGQQFLQRDTADQRGYVSTQLVMASTIAARIKPELSDCIGSTFFDDMAMSDQGFEKIIARISEFQDFHPSTVIVVVIENTCGPFN